MVYSILLFYTTMFYFDYSKYYDQAIVHINTLLYNDRLQIIVYML